MKFIDMFSGMGTVRMGFEQAGHECVYSIEWDKHKRKIYEVIFGHEPESSDIRSVRADNLPHADCWTFGAPCQDFSIAGTRSGLEGDRSSLVREVFRLVRETEEEHRPEWLLYENVKGMLSSNKGLDYLEILAEMGELGYDIEWQMLNSRSFGVPQNRQRVFTIGHLRRYGERKVFPITATGFKIGKPIRILAHSKYYRRNLQVFDSDGSVEAIDTSQGGGRHPHVIIRKDGKIKHNNTDYQYASCLTAGAHSGGNHSDMDMLYDDERVRRYTPREYMRLQGVPDYITDKLIESGISDTQLYRAAGDACTVNVIYEIASRMSTER